MKWTVTENLEWLRLENADDEMDTRQVESYFTREVGHFQKKARKGWDGKVPFVVKRNGILFLPVGLWMELRQCGTSYGIEMEVEGMDRVADTSVTKEELQAWVDVHFEGAKKKPYDYQVDAAFRTLRLRRTTQQLVTSAGKTLLMFTTVGFLLATGRAKKVLVIVPNTSLAIQGVEDFVEYGSGRIGMQFQQVHGEESGSRNIRSDANVVFGTYQSLVKRDPSELAAFDVILVDEAHQSPAVSIRKIIAAVATGGGGKYRMGVSGTITAKGRDSVDFLTVQAAVGPMVGEVTGDELRADGRIVPVEVRVVRMNWLPQEAREQLWRLRASKTEMTGADILNLEQKLVVRSRERLNFITDFILKTTKNSVVLFHSVEEGYGRAIYDMLREKSSTHEVYYVDGETKQKNRDEIKLRMKEGEGKIMVASYGTTSTGLNIPNLHTMFLVESYKSENIVKQSIGRMFRLSDGKEKALVVDFADDFTIGMRDNYLIGHMKERIRIYEQEGLPYTTFKVSF